MDNSEFVCAVPDSDSKGKATTFEIKDDDEFVKDMIDENNNRFFDSDVHKKEAVNHPDHYNSGKIETIDIIRDQLTEDQFTGFCLGNAIKYVSRCQHKGHMVEDIEKAIWYLNQLIEN